MLLPHTQPQRRSDPSHLNYQHNSDYTCILCTELQRSSPGHYPHVHRVIRMSPPLCAGARAPELKERTRKSFKKNTCALTVRIFALFPSITAFCSRVRHLPSTRSCVTHHRTAVKAASGHQAGGVAFREPATLRSRGHS